MKRGGFFHRADVCNLNDVFGDGVRADTVFDEAEKLLSLVDETGDRLGLHEQTSPSKTRHGVGLHAA
jgi:hypothetical protein